MPAPVVSFDRVTKRFPGVVALREVSLDILPGELHAIVGENGAGKSTLVKCLSGVITDYEGVLKIRGQAVRFRGTRDAEAAGVAIIHQELNLVEPLSVAANIFLGRERANRLGWLDDHSMERAAAGLLDTLECPIDPRQPVRQLRVGDQQLVEIAKALSLEADILAMDEPTSALTETEAARLFRVVERLRVRGVTVLYISHKLDEVFRLAGRISVMRDGELISTRPTPDTSPREITHLMVGREIASTSIGQGRAPAEPVLEVRGLSLPWPGHARQWRLKDVSFSLRRGEILGIAGLMGAGRTELLECLFGSSPERPQGRIVLAGREVSFRHPSEARRAGVALVTEDRKRLGLFANLDVAQNVTIAVLQQLVRSGLLRLGAERDLAAGAVNQTGVKTASLTTSITALSGGNQQKAILGRWLLTRPKVLLLDDPTRGVDVGAKAELYRLMDELCREGLGIIVTSSELPELLTLCDRIVVLCEGRMTGELPRAQATEQRIMELATQREGLSRQGRA